MLVPRVGLLLTTFITALLVFQKGFLVKRQTLPNRSACTDVIANPNCWIKPHYDRVIWIVIDALRFDFAQPTNNHRVPDAEKFYRGNMPQVGALLDTLSSNTRLYHFVADAPTTTLQRLKALTTGTLPTFIEAGDNFGGTEITEDNIIDQLRSLGKNVTFLGDDTWTTLLPGRFTRQFAVPSFDIKDLHSVDDDILARIFNELARPDWQVLIAHFLGVDHCGHRYGPNHPAMAKKLNQMDVLIKRVYEAMDDDTLMLVMGDHGMTFDGDHGGDSHNEVDAALLVLSKKPLPNVQNEEKQSVSQVDLVPTLALLLDVPIPFSSLGAVIPSLIPPEALSAAFKANCMQIVRFAQTYVRHDSTLASHLEWILREYEAGDEDDSDRADVTIRRLQQVLRQGWSGLDQQVALVGLLALVEAILLAAVQLVARTARVDGDFYGQLSLPVWVFRSGVLFLQLSLLLRGHGDGLLLVLLNASLALSSMYHAFILVLQLLSLQFSWSAVLPPFFIVMHALSYFSNSFIVYEPAVLRFELQTILLIVFFQQIRKQPRSTRKSAQLCWQQNWPLIAKLTVALLAVRIGAFFERCREEQIKCVPSLFAASLSNLPDDAAKISRLIFGLCSLAGLNWLLVRDSRNSASMRTVCAALSWPITVIIGFYWVCDALLSHMDSFLLKLAQIVYVYFLFTLLCSLFCGNREVALRNVFHALTLTTVLIIGDGLAPNLAFLFLVHDLVSAAMSDAPICRASFSVLLMAHGFFSLAHTATLAHIPWQAAFVGVPGNFALQFVPAALVLLHLFATYILLPLRDWASSTRTSETGVLAVILLAGVKASGVCVAALVHQKHLMLFKVFAPKFIFEGVAFLILSAIVFLLTLLRSSKRVPLA